VRTISTEADVGQSMVYVEILERPAGGKKYSFVVKDRSGAPLAKSTQWFKSVRQTLQMAYMVAGNVEVRKAGQ
jgi:Ethanolamine utilization protein EutJ (predicted chaperonin)